MYGNFEGEEGIKVKIGKIPKIKWIQEKMRFIQSSVQLTDVKAEGLQTLHRDCASMHIFERSTFPPAQSHH